MRYSAYVFDLDGTLIDSLPAIRDAMLQVCRAMELPEPDRRAAQGFVGAGVPEAMRRMLAWAGADAGRHGEAVERMLDAYGAVPVARNAVLPDARAVLADLAARGVPVGLCTNKPRAPTTAVLDGLGLGPFGAVACGDDPGPRKPDPAPLLRVCGALGTAPDASLYVGDSEIDSETAHRAGVPFALLEDGYLNGPLVAEPHLRLARLRDLTARSAP